MKQPRRDRQKSETHQGCLCFVYGMTEILIFCEKIKNVNKISCIGDVHVVQQSKYYLRGAEKCL